MLVPARHDSQSAEKVSQEGQVPVLLQQDSAYKSSTQ